MTWAKFAVTCVAAAPLLSLWCERALTRQTFPSWEVELRWRIREEGEAFGACTEGIIHTLVHCMLEETHWAYELGFIRSRHKAMSVTAGVQTLCNHSLRQSSKHRHTVTHKKTYTSRLAYLLSYSSRGMKTMSPVLVINMVLYWLKNDSPLWPWEAHTILSNPFWWCHKMCHYPAKAKMSFWVPERWHIFNQQHNMCHNSACPHSVFIGHQRYENKTPGFLWNYSVV